MVQAPGGHPGSEEGTEHQTTNHDRLNKDECSVRQRQEIQTEAQQDPDKAGQPQPVAGQRNDQPQVQSVPAGHPLRGALLRGSAKGGHSRPSERGQHRQPRLACGWAGHGTRRSRGDSGSPSRVGR